MTPIATIVRLPPTLRTAARPNRTRYGIVGTRSLRVNSDRCSTMMTGFSPKMASSRRPFASKAVAGIATLMPGTCANHACRLFECCGPCPQPRPTMARMTIGSEDCVFDLNRHRAIQFTMASIEYSMKSRRWWTRTGLQPATAAPIPVAVMALSDTGKSRTRSGPKRSTKPVVDPKTPGP